LSGEIVLAAIKYFFAYSCDKPVDESSPVASGSSLAAGTEKSLLIAHATIATKAQKDLKRRM
jgi:hypothetical protein